MTDTEREGIKTSAIVLQVYCITTRRREAVTHVKSSISRSARWESASAIFGPSAGPSSRMLRSAALPWSTFGQTSPPCPSTPFDMPPQARSSSDSVRARMCPPPPPFVTRRASYASVAVSVSVSVSVSVPVVGRRGWGSRRSRLKPA
jgi:hypothetical protein